MKMEKNTPKVWDELWENSNLEISDYDIKNEQGSVSWRKIENSILKKFGSFENLNVIEIGAGIGSNALLFALRGANVTILDYSEKALERSKEIFKKRGLNAKFICVDILKDKKFDVAMSDDKKFDVAMSFGLAEHFLDKNREKVLDFHFNLIKDNGLVLISVPNKLSPLYMVWKSLSKLFGKWNFGEEYPFTPREFSQYSKAKNRIGKNMYGSFLSSISFINPFTRLMDVSLKNKQERAFFLDKPLGYSIIYHGEKK